MIKVLLVDDDYEVLEGIEGILDWNELGFEIVGKAEDGMEALEIGIKTLPDVLVTDITMPLMSGMELIQNMKKVKADIKTVLLTCHEDFYYAKEAINLDVDEYLVKYTLTKEILVDVLQKLKLKSFEEKNQKETFYLFSSEFFQNKNVFMEKLLNDISEGKINSRHKLDEKSSIYNVRLPDKNYRVIGMFIDNYEQGLRDFMIDDSELLSFSIINISEEIFEKVENICIFPYNNNFILLFWDGTEDIAIKQMIIDCLKKVQFNVSKFLKIHLSICIGEAVNSIWNIKHSINNIEKLRENYFYLSPEPIIYKNAEFSVMDTVEVYKSYIDDFKITLCNGSPNELKSWFQNICEKIESERYSPQNVKDLFNRFVVDINLVMRKWNNSSSIIKISGDTFEICKKQLWALLETYLKIYEQNSNVNYCDDVQKVIRYINNNLDKDISLETVATHIFKNSCHLSRTFKKETGYKFSEYLIKKRIEKATFLLTETNTPVETVCKLVGIENVYYFYRFYKKETGKTPGEVRGK